MPWPGNRRAATQPQPARPLGRAPRRWPVRVAALAAALGLAAAVAGCANLSYYAQSVQGHLQMVQQARPVADWLADPATPPALRERLQQAQQMRRFAVTELALPDNASYTRYADLGRSAVVWNVVAAPELSLRLKTWCFALLGCVSYRGYFDRAAAEAEAATLQAQGWEVNVYGVPAYSTLGYTNWLGGDPLLNTFVNGSPADLARLLFHELAHQVLYVADDSQFNESYATAVERLGLQRWRQRHGGAEDDALQQRRRQQFRALSLRARQGLQAVYASGQPPEAQRLAKARVMAAWRAEYAALKQTPDWAGFAGYDAWVARANNAVLALQSTYDGLVPAFEQLHQQNGGDFARFHAEVQRLAALPPAQRRATLDRLLPPAAASAPLAPLN